MINGLCTIFIIVLQLVYHICIVLTLAFFENFFIIICYFEIILKSALRSFYLYIFFILLPYIFFLLLFTYYFLFFLLFYHFFIIVFGYFHICSIRSCNQITYNSYFELIKDKKVRFNCIKFYSPQREKEFLFIQLLALRVQFFAKIFLLFSSEYPRYLREFIFIFLKKILYLFSYVLIFPVWFIFLVIFTLLVDLLTLAFFFFLFLSFYFYLFLFKINYSDISFYLKSIIFSICIKILLLLKYFVFSFIIP